MSVVVLRRCDWCGELETPDDGEDRIVNIPWSWDRTDLSIDLHNTSCRGEVEDSEIMRRLLNDSEQLKATKTTKGKGKVPAPKAAPVVEGMMQCPHCDGGYVGKKGLDAHLIAKHSDVVETFACDDCGKVYLSERGLRKHRTQTHKEN